MNGRIIIIPSESTALAKLEWVAELERLYVTYSSNEQATYTCDNVDWSDLRELLDAVSVHDSWGSALHYWKKKREEDTSLRDEVVISAIMQSLDTRGQLRLLERLKDNLGDGKSARFDRFVRRD